MYIPLCVRKRDFFSFLSLMRFYAAIVKGTSVTKRLSQKLMSLLHEVPLLDLAVGIFEMCLRIFPRDVVQVIVVYCRSMLAPFTFYRPYNLRQPFQVRLARY